MHYLKYTNKAKTVKTCCAKGNLVNSMSLFITTLTGRVIPKRIHYNI